MKKTVVAVLILSCLICCAGCSGYRDTVETQDESDSGPEASSDVQSSGPDGFGDSVTKGTDNYRGFSVDNILNSEADGDIHFNLYVPDSYDGSEAYALYITLPGYQGQYFQGASENLKTEEFGFEAQSCNDRMIIVAPQLSDWGG